MTGEEGGTYDSCRTKCTLLFVFVPLRCSGVLGSYFHKSDNPSPAPGTLVMTTTPPRKPFLTQKGWIHHSRKWARGVVVHTSTFDLVRCSSILTSCSKYIDSIEFVISEMSSTIGGFLEKRDLEYPHYRLSKSIVTYSLLSADLSGICLDLENLKDWQMHASPA